MERSREREISPLTRQIDHGLPFGVLILLFSVIRFWIVIPKKEIKAL